MTAEHDPPESKVNGVGRHWRIGFVVVSLVWLIVAVKIEVECLTAYLFEKQIASSYASTAGHGVSAAVKAIESYRGRADKWSLRVVYRFTVHGMEYEGSRCGLEGVLGRFEWRRSAAE